MKIKNVVSVFLIVLVLTPQITFASWWNPFTWKIFKRSPKVELQNQVLPKEEIAEIKNDNEDRPISNLQKTFQELDKKYSNTDNLSKAIESNKTKTTENKAILVTPAITKEQPKEIIKEVYIDSKYIPSTLKHLTEDKDWFKKTIELAKYDQKNVGGLMIKSAKFHTESLKDLSQFADGQIKEYIISSIPFFTEAEKEITDFQKSYNEPIRLANEGIKSIEIIEQKIQNGITEEMSLEIFKATTETHPKTMSLIYDLIEEITNHNRELNEIYGDAWKEHIDRIKLLNDAKLNFLETTTSLNKIKDEARTNSLRELQKNERIICNSTTEFNGLFGKAKTTTICN